MVDVTDMEHDTEGLEEMSQTEKKGMMPYTPPKNSLGKLPLTQKAQ